VVTANKNGIRMPRAERYQMIVRLREQGKTFEEIVAITGMAKSSITSVYYDPSGDKTRARKAKYGGSCVDCGARTAYITGGGTAKRCASCAAKEQGTIEYRRGIAKIQRKAQRGWLDADVFAAIRSVAVDGRVSKDAYDRARDERGRATMPSVAGLVYRYGSWRNAVEAAGLQVVSDGQPRQYKTRYTNEALLDAIEDCAAQVKRWPSYAEYEGWAAGGVAPSGDLVRLRFNGWMAAIDAAMERNGGQVPT
jgi:hypothetical protein